MFRWIWGWRERAGCLLADPHPSVEGRFGLLGGGKDVCYCFCQLGKQGDPVKHLVLEEREGGC